MMSLESGLSSLETHSESEEVTEKGYHIENRGGGCEFVNPVYVQQSTWYSRWWFNCLFVVWLCGGIPCF